MPGGPVFCRACAQNPFQDEGAEELVSAEGREASSRSQRVSLDAPDTIRVTSCLSVSQIVPPLSIVKLFRSGGEYEATSGKAGGLLENRSDRSSARIINHAVSESGFFSTFLGSWDH